MRVHHCGASDDPMLEFSLLQPDLSASLICPVGAAKIELQDIRCQIEITKLPDAQNTKKRKRTTRDEAADEMVSIAQSETAFCSDLNSQDRSAVHDFTTGLIRKTDNVSRIHMENILQAAMTALVTGSARHFPDVTVRQGVKANALMRLAPAVFNVPYVKVCE